jgi:hypothetical protein
MGNGWIRSRSVVAVNWIFFDSNIFEIKIKQQTESAYRTSILREARARGDCKAASKAAKPASRVDIGI